MPELEARPLPGKPGELVAELCVELVHALFAVGRSGQCDRPVGVQVIDVREGKEAVERRVDRRRGGIVAEGDERIEFDHRVLFVDAPILLLEREQLVEIEGREARPLDAAEIAAAALDPEHELLLAVDGIDGFELGAGVAAAEVGQAEVRAEQVRAIAEKFGSVQGRSEGIVPLVF